MKIIGDSRYKIVGKNKRLVEGEEEEKEISRWKEESLGGSVWGRCQGSPSGKLVSPRGGLRSRCAAQRHRAKAVLLD